MIIIDPPLTRVQISQVVIGCLGLVLIAIGGVWAISTIAPADYPAIVAWVVAAIVIHDGLLAPLVVAAGLSGRRITAFIGVRASAVARTALVIASCCSLIAIPGIIVRAQGARNGTIHTVDYVFVLAVLWLAALAVAAGAVAAGGFQARRARARTK